MSQTLLSADSGSVLAADSNPLPYYTIRDIAIAALKDVGVLGIGMSPQNEDLNDALFKLNGMIAQWRRKRWLNYHLLDLSVVATGATSYPIGPVGPLAQTGAIYMPSRPDKLEAAYVRQLILAGNAPNAGPVDYPLTLIQSYEEYSRIALKSLVSFPRRIFYDSGFPIGTLYPWPVPQANIYELHVLIKQTLSQYGSINAQVILPEEYVPALHWNLVLRLAPGYKQPLDPTVAALAKDALNVLRMGNTQIGQLKMPVNLHRTGVYNPYSDQIL